MPGWKANQMLKVVTQWACDRWLVFPETQASVMGRVDALLVPYTFKASDVDTKIAGSWTHKMHIFGVEIKASRDDFKRGLDEGQFDRYSKTLGGLFVATEPEIKTREIPKNCGHLIIKLHRPELCVCRRMPVIQRVPLDEETCWRLVMLMANKFRDVERDRNLQRNKAMHDVGRKVAQFLGQLADEIENHKGNR